MIEKGEHNVTEERISDAIMCYKDANTELMGLLSQLKNDKNLDTNILESVELLKTNVSQVIFDLSNLPKEQEETPTSKEMVNCSILQRRNIIRDSLNSTTLQQDLNKLSPENDILLSMIMNKLQKNLLDTSSLLTTTPKSNEEKEQIFIRHIEQFKKELVWYEKKKFSQYDTDLSTLTKENAKLRQQVEKLRDRWNNLVESARQKREHQ